MARDLDVATTVEGHRAGWIQQGYVGGQAGTEVDSVGRARRRTTMGSLGRAWRRRWLRGTLAVRGGAERQRPGIGARAAAFPEGG